MADQDPNELVVASYGNIWAAPVGTPLPALNADPVAALDAAFINLGYATEDGVKFSSKPEIKDIPAWQSLDPVRRLLTGRENQLDFSLLQWDGDNVVFAFGGGTVIDGGTGIYSYQPPAATDALAEKSVIIDWQDGDKNYRLVVPRGNATEGTETQLQRSEAAVLPVGFKALAPAGGGAVWYLNTTHHAFATGS